MKRNVVNWEILGKIKNKKTIKPGYSEIVDVLLKNRGIETKKQKDEFFNPKHPCDLELSSLGISTADMKKALRRIKKAIKDDEQIIIYGDYDADGICATAILWEILYSFTKNVAPYLPDRFEEGYGINVKSVENLKSQFPNLKLIITVDNGIVANKAVIRANKLGIDVVVTDHHQKGKKIPKASAIIHTTQISGSAVAWILSREISRVFEIRNSEFDITNSLELVAIGTIADQMPLVGPNRSFAKYGLEALNKTKRPGIKALLLEAGLSALMKNTLQGNALTGQIGTYEVNFVIAPRLNAMGRLKHALDSLRLLCTKNSKRAEELADVLGRTNKDRQKIVEEVVLHARQIAGKKSWRGAIVLSHKSYHEGVIGLAASKIVEEFGRPAIIFSEGDEISKASARSIPGFNIIESINVLENIILGGGGHPMAAGFSIETKRIDTFKKEFEKLSAKLMTDEILNKKIIIDLEMDFRNLDNKLMFALEKFEPFGIGNPTPFFVTKKVRVVNLRPVGSEARHLKLTLEKEGLLFSAIAFGKGEFFEKMSSSDSIDVVYGLTRDLWNGNNSLQLKVKDLRLN